MKNCLLLFLCLVTGLCDLDAQSCTWLTQIGGNGYDYLGGIAPDPQGNLLVAGSIGDIPSLFLSKLDRTSGIPAWTKKAIGSAAATAVAVNDSGFIYVAGVLRQDTVIFDDIKLAKTNYADMFLVKFTPNGQAIWGHTAKGALNPRSMAINENGDVVLCGEFTSDTAIFGSVILPNKFPYTYQGQTPNRDMFLVKYTSGGNAVWARAAGADTRNADGVSAGSLALDGENNIYITGCFACKSLAFDNHVVHLADSTNGTGDMFLVKYDNSGAALWAVSAGGCCGTYGIGVALDAAGSIYVAGGFESPDLPLGNTTLINPNGTHTWYGSKYPADFLVKYQPNGKVAWANRFSGSQQSMASSVTVDQDQNVALTGYLFAGGDDLIVVKYDKNGDPLFRKYSTGGWNSGYRIISDKFNDLYVGGHYYDYGLTFDSCTSYAMGKSDIFILDIHDNSTSSVAEIHESDLTLYPNPCSGTFRIQGVGGEKITCVQVYDMLGNLVYRAHLSHEHEDVSLPPSGKGIYFASLESGTEKIIRKIVVE